MMRSSFGHFGNFWIAGSWLLMAGCSASLPPPYNPPPTPANMVLLPRAFNNGLDEGMYYTAVWSKSGIFATNPPRQYNIDSSFKITTDSVLPLPLPFMPGLGVIAMRIDPEAKHLLCILTPWPDVSLGRLEEVSLSNLTTTLLLSDTNISSAVYLSDDSIIYYTYGSITDSNHNRSDAGYYLFIKSTGQKQLLLHHLSNLGPGEVLNGFDISPDHSKIIVPSVGWNRAPIVFEFNLKTHEQDTLPIPFNTSNDRWCLYLRYNHDGSKILYSSYPIQAIEGVPNDGSEVGIIDRATLQKHVLNTNPYPDASTVICLFPDWSPDERSIVYGSAVVVSEPAGQVSGYQATILKTLN